MKKILFVVAATLMLSTLVEAKSHERLDPIDPQEMSVVEDVDQGSMEPSQEEKEERSESKGSFIERAKRRAREVGSKIKEKTQRLGGEVKKQAKKLGGMVLTQTEQKALDAKCAAAPKKIADDPVEAAKVLMRCASASPSATKNMRAAVNTSMGDSEYKEKFKDAFYKNTCLHDSLRGLDVADPDFLKTVDQTYNDLVGSLGKAPEKSRVKQAFLDKKCKLIRSSTGKDPEKAADAVIYCEFADPSTTKNLRAMINKNLENKPYRMRFEKQLDKYRRTLDEFEDLLAQK